MSADVCYTSSPPAATPCSRSSICTGALALLLPTLPPDLSGKVGPMICKEKRGYLAAERPSPLRAWARNAA
eukprot:9367785-Alexandrium_andersonii.AAC.1